jgi:hypothetical protein
VRGSIIWQNPKWNFRVGGLPRLIVLSCSGRCGIFLITRGGLWFLQTLFPGSFHPQAMKRQHFYGLLTVRFCLSL